MKMKKIFSTMMALGLAATLAACGGDDAKKDDAADKKDDQAVDQAADKKDDKDAKDADENALSDDEKAELDNFDKQTADDTLVVGTSEMSGDFYGSWSNNSYDVKVRRYIGTEGNNAYLTMVQDEGGQWKANMTILEKEPETVKNEDGSETTTFTIKKDLKWSDGQPITADNYLFDMLFHAYPSYQLVTGAFTIGADSVKGYEAYKGGDDDKFEGLEKVDDYTFKVTTDASYLPYYESAFLKQVSPFPIHAIADNIEVAKEGNKIVAKDGYKPTEDEKKKYIENIDAQIAKTNEDFNEQNPAPKDDASEDEKKAYEEAKAENDKKVADLESRKSGDIDPTNMLIEEAMQKEFNEYRIKPTVSCGPYKFDSYENNMAKLSLNENYAGNFKGEKATIPHVIVQYVNSKIAVDLLENGDIDLWESEAEGALIDQMRAAADEGKIGGYNTFERNGYGNVVFLTDRGTTKYKEVRQAIAHLMDRNSYVQSFAGGYGVVTNGMYGTSQWMYKERGADLEASDDFNKYTLNLEKANELLDKTPFKFEKDGKTPWDKKKADEEYAKNPDGFDYYRYDENGKKLQVNQYGSDESPITTLISNQVPVNAKQVGMEYNVTAGSFATLLDYYYHPKEDAEYTVFNMGLSFGTPFDPWYQYNSKGSDNMTRTNDPKADELTVKLRQTDPDDKEGYLDTWEEFEKWYNDYLPEIPLYSNQYHSGYSKRVKGFDINTPVWESEYQINAMSLDNSNK
ncbi:ABC transporter substrate-binding protein [Anaerococcus sp. NML200537]|uniref:ABC transporter substrate-binding protein n=1 Tax=Anaerococcus kampingae TaxID=3115614 RepID=A0ABW9MG62_9FIRM|nr:ABC transporter substrate-binding protein [Anaerococcus sp. NML200537]MCW6701964.1 ABC transporter substrate-binding protein [Anaerococcus sp. NML200537]